MNVTETGQLLAIAGTVDNRQLTEEAAIVWHQALGHLDLGDCITALNLHRQESAAYLQPAHIVANVKRIRADRQAHVPLAHDERKYPVPNNLEAWSAAHASPIEFARQEAIYHQQCRDEGFDPHEQQSWASKPFVCYSCNPMRESN